MDNNLLTPPIAVGIMVVLMILVNAVLLFNIFSAQRKASAMQTWPSASGTVVESELRSRRRGSSRRIYYPHIVYSYNVMGQAYMGKRIGPGKYSGTTTAREIVAKYPSGASVEVYYDPQNPSEAVLETDVSKTMPRLWVSLVIANLTLCMCVALPLFLFVFSKG